MTDTERKQKLDNDVALMVRTGWRVESKSDYQAVLVKGKRPNHILHLLLSIFTVGLWIPVWIVLAITSHEKRRVVTVDQQGAASVAR